MLAHLTPAADLTAPCPKTRNAEVDRAELAWLRVAGARCRVMRRSDLFQACAVLSLSGEQAALAYAQALFRALPDLLPRGLTLYAPGDSQISFDEAWLLQLLTRARAGDHDSLTFLIGRRIPRYARRQVAFLAHGLATAREDGTGDGEKNCV
ncbi:hypothetical protein E2K80_14305 [Rhodophyticola sp. CCM32]|uniref:hypothetical protein n=1 Tax=Rhodophyticola sp. CCM32 TaxID=2916397 RepID=UPI00107F31B8|nr:hypothetical protein [Rhodophyticola sp. CCM32]QBY01751.1 hypothetical protein E2K80_14305 [Rhodophyticola sp. CCM32]